MSLLAVPFLHWDDDLNIAANPFYLDGSLWHFWRAPYFGLYVPVTSTVWGALYHLAPGAAWPFRLLNAALHVANTLLVWRLLVVWTRRALPNTPAVAAARVVGVALFALHPLQTATVAWISAGRDLLATCAALGAALLYTRRTTRRYVAATALFAVALLCKPSVAGVPIAIALYAALFERAHLRRVVRDMSLWALLVVADALGTSALQSDMVRLDVPPLRRPLVALDALGFYLAKLVAPVAQSVDYGRTPAWLWAHPCASLATVAAVVVAVALVLWGARRRRAVAIAALWPALLLPVLGLVPFAFQRISTVADHYAYLPMAVVAATAAALAASVASGSRPRVVWALAAVVCVAGALGSWRRLRVWRSDEALFGDALAKRSDSWVALTALGQSACGVGDYLRGLDLTERALALQPADAPALANAVFCLYRAEQYERVTAFARVLAEPEVQFNFDRSERAAGSFLNILAGAYLARGEPRVGWVFLCQAVAVSPDAALAQNAADVQRALAAQGMPVACPATRLSWPALIAASRPDATSAAP